MSHNESPQDSLQHYFDDLLLGDIEAALDPIPQDAVPQDAVPQDAMPQDAVSQDSVPQPVVEAVSRTKAKPKVELRAEPKAKAAVAKPARDFAEPVAVPEHKAKVEKLLQSARPLPKVEAPVRESEDIIAAPVTPEVTIAEVIVTPEAVVEEAEIELDAVEDVALEGLEWLDNGLPAWAQERFDVLLFNVSGLTLAVPLIALGQIQPITDELTPIFGQADWFMGIQPTPTGKVRVVNTALFVMPERYDAKFVETAKYVVSINGLPWGLAVDSVNQPISLEIADVKWRSERSKRPWLAGTVKEQMCALIDIPRMGQLLTSSDRNSKADINQE